MISSKQRAYLRGLANDFPVILQIGKGGLTENLTKTVSEALEARELIKVHVLENSGEDPQTIANELAATVGADVVSVTGKKAVLYRRSSKKPIIELP
ncbi:MAG: ribosome assembly RNA-binding protein YhbY [Ruminococcaceae bacterium]|nr:ribosome assembly RNA-binding protein YhbY [Oscillospiraceae bacterium]